MESESIRYTSLGRLLLGGILSFLLLGLFLGGVTAWAPPAAPETTACLPLNADTTWPAGVYTATSCSVFVPAGVTLTLESGVIVKFGGTCAGYVNGCGLRVDGGLVAQGAPGQPVIFTSLADDSVGGDTNGDGPSTGSPGDWYGLYLAAGSQANLDHASFRYGGDDYAFNGALYGWSRSQIDVRDAQLSLTNSEVISGAANGIYLDGVGLTPVIRNVRIAGHTNPASTYYLDYALYQSTINMQPTYANLTFEGNSRNEVTVGAFSDAMTEDVTLGGANYGFTCGYSVCDLTIPNGRTLTVQPGTLLDFRRSYGIAIADGGALVAQGTASRPITFTAKLAEAGGTDQHWMGLWAKKGSDLHLDYCDIAFASDTNYGKGGLEINTDSAEVSNCRIHHNAGDGVVIYATGGNSIAPTLTNVSVTDNGTSGVSLNAFSSSVNAPVWEGGEISRNGYSGIRGYTDGSILSPVLKHLTVHANGARGDSLDGRMDALYFASRNGLTNLSPTLEDLTITDNPGLAIGWSCNGSITARDLTATGNSTNELLLTGCAVTGGRQWDLGEIGIPARVTGGIEVATNGLLTIQPGTKLLFDKNIYGSPTGVVVRANAALYALGTADKPIVFTGAEETPGAWLGIDAAYDKASLILDHCEVAYGGYYHGNIYAYGHSGVSPSPIQIQNCDIHHSAHKGVKFEWVWTQPPLVRYNRIHDNAEEGIVNWGVAPPIDARQNWWGDASGPYHPTQNPSGLGENVGDNITFYPWLGTPDGGQAALGEMLVTTGAPSRVSPGQTADYAIQYRNTLTETVLNAVLVVQLPHSGEYVSSTGGGFYWPERDQVFWKLGDIAPGEQGFLAFSVRFAWGLPRDYQDSTITLLSADNYNVGGLDTASYLAFDGGGVSNVSLLTPAQFSARLAANATLQAAYDASIAAGFTFHSGADVTRSEGETVLEAVFYNAGKRTARILSAQSGNVLVATISAESATLEDSTGGMRLDLQTGEKSVWGAWETSTDRAGVFLPAAVESVAGCDVDTCKRNCRWSIVGWEYIKKKAGRIIAWTALAPFTGGGSIAGAVWEVGSIAKKVYDCDLDCRANPSEYCCTAGQVRWSGGGIIGGFTNSCYKEKCNAAVGLWVPDGYKTCVAFGQRCVAGIRADGCVDCEEKNSTERAEAEAAFVTQTRTVTVTDPSAEPADGGLCAASTAANKPRCRDLELLLAKDPNAIYGPAGDLLPGATTLYTVTYENEGAGRAYGVYVVNPLADVFDAATLDLHGAGTYLPDSREIFWLVGELGPKGAADSEGTITYTVNLTGGLASGTIVENQAVVYFPSVPEETPTNTWVNLVSPLVAIPQELTTNYMTSLPITLAGREVSSQPLTFEIVEQPRGGVLTGTPPNLTYTPAENFTGPDSFTFRVDNQTSTSRAAQVRIDVTAAGDATPPAVVWTSPAADAKNVSASASPVYTDSVGPAYTPLIAIGVSEAVSETTVTTATVALADGSGAVMTGTVRVDANLNQIVWTPRVALADGEYIFTVGTGVTDVAGNGLTQPYILRFTVGKESSKNIYLPAIQR